MENAYRKTQDKDKPKLGDIRVVQKGIFFHPQIYKSVFWINFWTNENELFYDDEKKAIEEAESMRRSYIQRNTKKTIWKSGNFNDD